jgi:transglutaminase-like putative cysteine protease
VTTALQPRSWFVGNVRTAVFGWLASVAASVALFPTLHYKGFVIVGALVAAALVGIGIGLRALHVHWLLIAMAQVLLFAEWVVVRYAHRQAAGVLIPNAAVLRHLQHLLSQGVQTADLYAAPAPNVPGLELMFIAAIAGVAIAVDVVAASWRRVPWAGLPLLTIYTIPVATIATGIAWPYFVIGTLGYTSLVMADERERVLRWGRVVPRSLRVTIHETSVDTSALTWLGRRISVVAMVIAIAAPWLVPNLSLSVFDRFGNGTGSGTVGTSGSLTFADPMVGLAHNLQHPGHATLLTVRSTMPPRYIRMAVVDQASADGWRTTDPHNVSTTIVTGGDMPPLTGLDADVRQRPFTDRLTMAPTLDTQWLPVPYNVRRITVNGEWRYDAARQVVMSFTGHGDVGSYTAEASTVEPTEAKLRNAAPPPTNIAAAFGRPPSDLPPTVRDLAQTLTRGRRTEFDQALAIQDYLRGAKQFTYDTRVSGGDGYQALVNFLRDGHGYCQQFSAAMAYLARAAGLPARIAIGFLNPEGIDGHTYVFTARNLHAWPEIYFSGTGWVRFEPTPSIAGPPRYAGGPPVSTRPTSSGRATISGHHTNSVAPKNLGGVSTSPTSSGGQVRLPSRWWLLAVAAALAALGPALARTGLRRTRLARAEGGITEAESAWTELRDRLYDLRLPWPAYLTPRGQRANLSPLLGGDDTGLAALDRLTMSVERARFAPSPLPDTHPIDDMRTVASTITQRQTRFQRLRALLLPTSLVPDRFRPEKLSPRRRDGDASGPPSGA